MSRTSKAKPAEEKKTEKKDNNIELKGSNPHEVKDIMSYDAVPYLSHPFSQTHPTLLFTLAKLFGLSPKPIEKARILELGCSSGGNLIPVAYQYPGCECIGIDLSKVEIDDGIQQYMDLALKNITLRHQSITDFSEKEGKFDYIICHGVFSWVGPEVQDKILEICNKNLEKNGIAYVSYNTKPGWNMVSSVRDLMMWHTKNIENPIEKAKQARGILQFITNGLQNDQSPYASFLKNEINMLSRQADYYLIHEHLSFFNDPIHFYAFMEKANANKLSYLSDAFLATMFTGNLPPQFSNELNKINNIVVTGQYMDFIRNQRFRCTLLCHDNVTINRALKTTDVEDFYLSFSGRINDPNLKEEDLGDGKEITFSNNYLTMTLRNHISQLALFILAQQKKPIHYIDLCKALQDKGIEKSLDELKVHLNDQLNLMRALLAGLIQIHSYEHKYITHTPPKPCVDKMARYQAQRPMQSHITNLRHQSVGLDPVSKLLIPYMDGTKTIEDLLAIIVKHITAGDLSIVDKTKQPIEDPIEIEKNAKEALNTVLDRLSNSALFVKI
jgi:methyltransferase-like protein/2-polyprenyl-3-methyl-5-hydroxy-6-metoxy-1,4-benzoquinol methylase